MWTKIEDLKNIKSNAIPVCDDRYTKVKIRTFGDKVYTNFHGLNVPEDDINVNLLLSFLLSFYSYTTKNIICKYIRQLCL